MTTTAVLSGGGHRRRKTERKHGRGYKRFRDSHRRISNHQDSNNSTSRNAHVSCDFTTAGPGRVRAE
jgi:hypothetical protein